MAKILKPIILITIPDPTPDPIVSGGNKGYNGLGIHRKEIVQAPVNGSNLYILKSSDIVNDEYRITEEILNKMVLCKTTITNQYISIFMLDIGVDGDYIIFKNVNDEQENYEQSVEDKNSSKDYAYLEFYGDNYSSDAFVPDIWGHWLEFNHAEAMFIKEGSKWRRVETKGRNRLVEEDNPKAQNLYVQQLISSSTIRMMINNNRYVEIGNENIWIGRPIQPDYNAMFDLGTLAKRFKKIFAKNGDFSGTVKALDPVNDEDLATKKYVDDHSGGAIRRTTVDMDIVIPAGLPLDTDLGFYDIDTLIASQLTGDLLNTVEDNRLRLVQNCGLFQAQAKIVNIHLLAVYKDNGSSQYIDFDGYAKQDDTNTFKRILKYSGRSTENNILHSHSVFDVGYTSDVLGQGSELYLVVQRKFNNTNEIKARVHISIDYQL